MDKIKEYYQQWLEAWKGYKTFTGRTNRKDYWTFVLCNLVVLIVGSVVLGIVAGIIAGICAAIGNAADAVWIITIGTIIAGLITLVIGIASLVMMLGLIAPTIRRLHDTGKSGWFTLLWIVPCCGIGQIALIVLCALPGTEGENQFG